ncbi:hypothetical protein IQ254_00340 [Nodosilinea sp. LEGE 07088]|uniref:hypothetical protein n=1 Tax=Nodosilinea sp. LEGE 07088 TaxID=2777968 RepID=UPI0018815468|nr:hypothetical protein [Nodosilinea sp. LEGE 07088]MBE9135668.1 hypothetical protein [Nodosilinea sp. LEGE 07088]
MDAKVLASGAVGFAAGIVVTLLVGVLLMGGMMGRGGMMRGWGCSSTHPFAAPLSEASPATTTQRA